MSDNRTCAHCGHRNRPDRPECRRRFLRVVDELGASDVCSLCTAQLVLQRDGLTLLVARPVAVTAS